MKALCSIVVFVSAALAAPVFAQSVAGDAADGAAVFARECATCHVASSANLPVPSPEVLRQLSSDALVTALTSGRMRVQGERLSESERHAVAEFLTGKPVSASASAESTRCPALASMPAALQGPMWNGWGAGLANARYQVHSGLPAANVPKLKLAWAFGFAGSLAARAQPTVVAGRLFTGSERGEVFALDAKTGCTHWVYRAQAAVRTAMTVASYQRSGTSTRFALYFGDGSANAYAVDAESGALLWSRKVDEHPNASITGAPVVHGSRVYVPTAAAGEEVRGGRLDYGCCTFRGSVSALDAVTGAVIWKSYSIPVEPKPRARNKSGVQLYGPAGGGIWGAPTVDVKRGVLYVGTGNGYSEPAQPTTSAILAFDLENGRLRWVKQTVPDDVWIWQCAPLNPDNPNCPTKQGPDFDFSTAPLMARTPQGRELLVVPQKSGVLYALDPDRNGDIVWQYRFGDGSALGGQWGAAADERNVYVGVGGTLSSTPGGMHAVDLQTGKRVWYSPPQPKLCAGGAAERCYAAQGGAVSVIPGVVWSGGVDGGLRAYATADGSIVWQVDTNREFLTVNRIKASGATIDGAGPIVVDGMLFVNSGYNGIVGRAGNVLLAFQAEQ